MRVVFVSTLLVLLCGGGGLEAQVNCSRSQVEELPRVTRGFSEIAVLPAFECVGGDEGSPVSVQIDLFVSVPVVNRVVGPQPHESNAVLLVGDPGPSGEALGKNFFQLRTNPDFARQLSATVTFTPKPNGVATIIQPFNVRIDTTSVAAGQNIVTGAMIGSTQFLSDIPFATATGEPPTLLEILDPSEAGFPDNYVAVVRVTETFPGSLRPRTLAGTDPQNDLAQRDLWRFTQSQFIPDDGSGTGDWRFAADAGNRIQLEFLGLESSVSAVTHPTFQAIGVEAATLLRLVSNSSRQMLGGTPAPQPAPTDSLFESEPAPYDPPMVQQFLLESDWLDEPAALDEPAQFLIPLAWDCDDELALPSTPVTIMVRHAPWPQDQTPLFEEKNGFPPISRPIPGPAFGFGDGPSKTVAVDRKHCMDAPKPPPMVSEGGVVNGASFAPGPVAPGSIISVFGTGLGPQESQSATTIPLPQSLGSTSVEVNGIQAPLLFVGADTLGQLNLQLPFELEPIPPSGGLREEGRPGQGAAASLVVIRDGVRSDAFEIPLVAAQPGIFTLDSGPGRAIAINPDGSLAQPVDSFPGVATRPVKIGEALIILATGLGMTTPVGVAGDDSLDSDGAFVRRDTVLTPKVTVGGLEAQLLFSGLSPQFVGVYQLNIVPADGTAIGDAQPLVIEMGGVRSRDDVTIAVAAR